MLPPPFALSTEKRQNRSLTQDVTPFLHNIIFQFTNTLPFEIEPHTIHTIPLVREHCDSYIYYIRYKTLEITPSQSPFQIIFNPVKRINTGTYYKTIHPQNITLSIQDVFITYIQKLLEFNENQETPLYLPSHLEDLKDKSEYFEVPDLETKIRRHDNAHYWLQQDILRVKNFQYRLFNNITLTDDTIPQVKVFTQFILKFFRFNYQLLWEQQDQQAYIHFSQILTQTELLPDIFENEHEHSQYRDPTSFNITHFEQINLDHNFITEYYETSDNRHYITTTVSHETASELSEDTEQIAQTVQNTQSLTITNDSNLKQVLTHNITPEENNNQNQDNTSNTTQHLCFIYVSY